MAGDKLKLRRALAVLTGDGDLRRGIELWLAGRSADQLAAATAYWVVTYLGLWKATRVGSAAYRTAKDAGHKSLAVVLIGAICHVVGGRVGGLWIANAGAFQALGMLWKACYVAEPVV